MAGLNINIMQSKLKNDRCVAYNSGFELDWRIANVKYKMELSMFWRELIKI